MYTLLVLLLMGISLQASDEESPFKALDACWKNAISVEYPLDKFDIDKDSQIILPVWHGRYITLPLETVDVFTLDSIGNMIKETQESGNFYILASYRSKEKEGISHIKCATAASLVKNIRDKDEENRIKVVFNKLLGQEEEKLVVPPSEDPLTRLPIVKIDFHEFCYIGKKLAVRYLGETKAFRDVRGTRRLYKPLNELLSNIVTSKNDLVTHNIAVDLALLHAKNGDCGRAQKYIVDISENYLEKQHGDIFQIAHFAVQWGYNDVALQALNKISASKNIHLPLLLYKLGKSKGHTDQVSLCKLLFNVLNVLAGIPQAELCLARLYESEAIKIGLQVDEGKKFLDAAAIICATDAQKKNQAISSFNFLECLSWLGDDQSRLRFATLEQLEIYANQCIDVINNGDATHQIIKIKQNYPHAFERVVVLLKKYGTNSLTTKV